MNNFDLEYRFNKEMFCGSSVGLYELEDALSVAENEIERNQRTVNTSHNFGSNVMSFFGVMVAFILAVLPSDEYFRYLFDALDINELFDLANIKDFVVIYLIKVLVIAFCILKIEKNADKKKKESNMRNEEALSDNKIQRLKIRIISEEIEKRKAIIS